MVKQHGQIMQFCLGLCDIATVGAAWALAYLIRFQFFPSVEIPALGLVTTNLVVALLIALLVLVGMGLYKPRRDKSFLLELGQLIKAALLIWVLLNVVLYYTHSSPFTRLMLGIFLPTMMAGLVVERGMFRMFLHYIRRRGWNLRHALIVGTGRLGQSMLFKLRTNSWTGIRVKGFVDVAQTPARAQVRGVSVVGGLDDLRRLVESGGVDCVFVALPAEESEHLRTVIGQLEQTAVDVRIIPDLFLSRFPMNVTVGELDGLPVLALRENPLAGWPAVYKRVFDIFGALFGLAIFGLPMAIIALLIKVTSRGPVIYRQRRISFGGKPFEMYKFRTMVTDAEVKAGAVFAMRNDPRCTAVGKRLRALSLDELPQLFNVLKGDMSLVGPRPERPELIEKIRQEVPGFPLRLKVRAGLTGWAQVHGYRGRTSLRKRLQYDLYYLNHWSPMLDLRIVLATIFRGFRHPNAY